MRARLLLIAIVVMGLLSGCASAGDELAEQIIESQGGGDVEIDSDSGEVSVETDDGSVVIGGGELPAGFPVDIPGDAEVVAVGESGDVQTVQLSITGGDFADTVSFYESWVATSGLEEVNKAEFSNPPSVGWTLQDGEGSVTVSIAEVGPDVAVTIVVANG